MPTTLTLARSKAAKANTAEAANAAEAGEDVALECIICGCQSIQGDHTGFCEECDEKSEDCDDDDWEENDGRTVRITTWDQSIAALAIWKQNTMAAQMQEALERVTWIQANAALETWRWKTMEATFDLTEMQNASAASQMLVRTNLLLKTVTKHVFSVWHSLTKIARQQHTNAQTKIKRQQDLLDNMTERQFYEEVLGRPFIPAVAKAEEPVMPRVRTADPTGASRLGMALADTHWNPLSQPSVPTVCGILIISGICQRQS